MQRTLALFFLLSLLSFGCEKKPEAETTKAPMPEGQPQQEAASNTPTYPSIPLDRLVYLWENATYMDVVFYELPVSLNQSTPEQVRSTIAHIAEDAPIINPNCKSVGRIFFQVEGKNVEEAEIYFENGCTYYVWLEEGKPAYANNFTKAGVDFYNNIYAQVGKMNQ